MASPKSCRSTTPPPWQRQPARPARHEFKSKNRIATLQPVSHHGVTPQVGHGLKYNTDECVSRFAPRGNPKVGHELNIMNTSNLLKLILLAAIWGGSFLFMRIAA